jgi:simple sugar transport system ATP-binding protein
MRALKLETIDLTKRFGAFTALNSVNLTIRPGSVHALLGENGAGKSTLVKTVIGYQKPDGGSIVINDREVSIDSLAQARSLGIGMVFQHFTLIPTMTVAENLLLARGRLPAVIDWDKAHSELEEFIKTTPFKLPLLSTPDQLSAGEKQKLEILKQLILNPSLLILDEPTSVLTPQEADEVLLSLQNWAHAGNCSIILITHKFREVFAYADDVTVLKHGQVEGSMSVGASTPEHLAQLMVGESRRVFELPHKSKPPSPDVVLDIRALNVMGARGERAVDGFQLQVHAGEIVGLAGVSGNGQKELLQALTAQRPSLSGEVWVEGELFHATREQNRRLKVRSLPEEPLQNACVGNFTVAQNMCFRVFDQAPFSSFGFLRFDALRMYAVALIEQFRVKTPSPMSPIANLSGGNIQRAVLARELSNETRLLLVSNPVFGLDFASVADIHKKLIEARNRGTAVLLISEDLDELLQLSDRIAVISGGRVVYEAQTQDAQRGVLGLHMGASLVDQEASA